MDTSTFSRSIRGGTNPDSTNKRGARRDARLIRLAQIGPIWVGILVTLRLFQTRQTAERRLKKLEESGRLRYAGRVSIDGGKPIHLWCNRRFWDRMLRHEVDAMRVFYAYWPHAYALTGADADPRWRADMELTIGGIDDGRKHMVEIDEGTEPLNQVRKRLAVYTDCPHTVLFVAPTLSRANEAIRLTDNPRIYVSTIERCGVDPWGGHWRNCLGETGHVAKPAA
jgi:hypothetical protein